jgi:hypothetical protein
MNLLSRAREQADFSDFRHRLPGEQALEREPKTDCPDGMTAIMEARAVKNQANTRICQSSELLATPPADRSRNS